MGVYGGVSRRTRKIFVIPVGDVLLGPVVPIPLRKAEVDDLFSINNRFKFSGTHIDKVSALPKTHQEIV